MTGPNIELRIGDLVLVGLSATDGPRLLNAFSDRLTELLGSSSPHGFSDRAVGRLDGGTLLVASDARPDVLGAALADAVHRSLA